MLLFVAVVVVAEVIFDNVEFVDAFAVDVVLVLDGVELALVLAVVAVEVVVVVVDVVQ